MTEPYADAATAARFQVALLAWFAAHQRALPWRATRNPFALWVAETMLQQTTTAVVKPYFAAFMQRFPTVQALAEAEIGDVLAVWQGLGYYRRAHLLHKGAQHVAAHGGVLPNREAALLTIPGIGAYTAAVLAATAFGQPAVVVDGNVARVMARLARVEAPWPRSAKQIRAVAHSWQVGAPPRDYANAIMELGHQICTPTSPQCLLCPVQAHCVAWQAGVVGEYPRKVAKAKVPQHAATVWWVVDETGAVFLRQRPATGLLAGLWELPHTGWQGDGLPAAWSTLQGTTVGGYTHVFTHFRLKVTVQVAKVPGQHPAGHGFAVSALPPLPNLMKKAAVLAQAALAEAERR